MPQQRHHKGSEREQGKRETRVERGGKGREGKQREAGAAGRSNNDGRAEKKTKHQTARTQTPKSARRERYQTPRIRASGAGWGTARAPGLDRPGVNPVPRTGASEATGRIRQKDAPDWSFRGGMKHGISPRTGSSGGEPGATDWSVRGNGENTKNDAPDGSIRGGMKRGTSPRTGSSGGEPDATDWNVRGSRESTTKRHPGLEHPGRYEARH